MNTLTLEQIREAQAKIINRHQQTVTRIQEIEDGTPAMLIRFAKGEVDRTLLDALANELPQLREIVAEDTAAAVGYFDKLAAAIMEEKRADRNKEDLLAQKRAWAERYNDLISRTAGFTELEASELLFGRPADFPGGGPAWNRFLSMRQSFAALPGGTMTYAQHADLESYHPE